ncbi:hypothetical protein BJY00DRAFT_272465 [Aspergillus carlsbadensis]|nr:hypothetical protein BJY00DRAFT_272465 [Aspergillus carlsbadensis]
MPLIFHEYLREKWRLQAELLNMLLSIFRKPYLGTYLRHVDLGQALVIMGLSIGQPNLLRQQTRNHGARNSSSRQLPRWDSKSWKRIRLCLILSSLDPRTIEQSDTMASYTQTLAALLVSVSPTLEFLAFCSLVYEYTDESGVP